MRSLSLIALFGLVLPLGADPKKELTDQEKLQGEWVMVGLEVREEAVPAAKLAGTTLVIKKDKYTTVVKKEYPVTFTLDPKQDPKHIDMMIPDDSGTPQLSKGIYKIDGDKLIICRGQAPGGERPELRQQRERRRVRGDLGTQAQTLSDWPAPPRTVAT